MSTGDIYRVEAAALSERLARGWHCLGPVGSFDDGKPHMIEAFRTQIVIFKTESGALAALNNFCPHMGASLADGRVRGEAIACPFHDWRWGADGACVAIPYARRIPVRARTRSWPLCVVNDVLYIWHDPEGNVPDVTLSPIEEFETAYSGWSYSSHRIDTNTRELVDNLVDVAHFFYVHGQGVSRTCRFFANRFEGQEAWQFLEGGELPAGDYDIMQPGAPLTALRGRRTETCYNGPAYLKSRVMMHVEGDAIEAYIILGQLPITAESFDLHMLITTRERADLSVEENAARSERVAHMLREGTLQDVHIWKTKTRIDNPLLCEGDGPVYQLRRWYEQFFVDVADIDPVMIARFEQVTDTTYSCGVWEEQARENLAERALEAAARSASTTD